MVPAGRRAKGVSFSVEIAVVISTFERPGHLERCLASLEGQRGVEGLFEVVVADDGSRDETLRLLAAASRRLSFPLTFTTHTHEGFRLARCRNEGVAASTAPYLLFTDGDCILPPNHPACTSRRDGRAGLWQGTACGSTNGELPKSTPRPFGLAGSHGSCRGQNAGDSCSKASAASFTN